MPLPIPMPPTTRRADLVRRAAGAPIAAARSVALSLVLAVALTVALAAALGGCAARLPPLQLYQLAAAPPVAAAAPVAASGDTAGAAVWQLLGPVGLPEYLDRDAVLVPQGQAGLQALPGHRWAEPLRDAVPRLLRQDLATLRGESRVWGAPLPAGIVVDRLLRVELLALESNAERSAVTVQARWTLGDARGREPARVDAALLSVPVAGSDVDSLVAAHRLALWRLAERIAGASAAR